MKLKKEKLLELYATMQTIRQFESRIVDLMEQPGNSFAGIR